MPAPEKRLKYRSPIRHSRSQCRFWGRLLGQKYIGGERLGERDDSASAVPIKPDLKQFCRAGLQWVNGYAAVDVLPPWNMAMTLQHILAMLVNCSYFNDKHDMLNAITLRHRDSRKCQTRH